MPVYLDYNASAPIDSRVLEYMIEVYRNRIGNADSRTHYFGTESKELVNASRKGIANILNIDSSDLFFTSGATESNNLAIIGLLDYALSSGRTHLITTAIEHKSVIETMHHMQEKGCHVDYVYPDSTGRIKPEQILNLVTDKTLMVSTMHVNSETGIIQPIKEIGDLLSGTDVLFHVDATQGFGKLNTSLRETKYDLMSFTAHKIGGPQGVGALVMKRNHVYRRPPIKPIMFGGQQERGFRPGTTPVALVAGFCYAAELCENESADYLAACQETKERFIKAISGLRYVFNGDQRNCLPSTVNVSFDGIDAEGIFLALKDEYAISNGSACNSGSHKPSYVLAAMGLDEKRISEAIRISWGSDTKVDFTQLVNYIRSMTNLM